MHPNLKAFLDMIAYSEGTDHPRQRTRDRGYDVIVGGALMDGYADHPRKVVDLPALKIKSTAAGRYQILSRYWDHYRRELGLVGGFTPENQDKVAIQLIRECKALGDIEAGRIAEATRKCRSRWASLPGAGYGQHEHKLDTLLAQYQKAGGVVA
ncbi:glycoside hydrolase family 24 protein [Methylobacillus pratensis]